VSFVVVYPLVYVDPSGHGPDCWDDDYACGADPAVEYEPPPLIPEPDHGDLPDEPDDDPLADAVEITVVIIDGIAYLLSGIEAVIVDIVGIVAIGIGVIVTVGSGPVGGILIEEAIKYTYMLDFGVTTTSILGATENLLGLSSFSLTALRTFLQEILGQ
jgi:hypothetical protein